MKLYKYKAVTKSGRPTNGVLSANDEVHLYQQLEAAEISLIKCSPVNKQGTFTARFFAKKAKIRDLLQFYIQMEQMQKSGIPLLDGLGHCRMTVTHAGLRDVISELHRLVSEGMSLSEAFGQFPEYFSKLERSIIGASEKTGNMVASYNYLIEYFKALDEMQRRIRKATRYPMILVFVILLAVTILMNFVVPQIIQFIRVADGGELPFATVALIATSDFFAAYWWICLALIIGGVFFVSLFRRLSMVFRHNTDQMVLNSPMIGDLMRKIEISRFSYIVSSLYKAGVPFLECLQVALESIENRVISAALSKVIEDMQAGETLSDALNTTGEFPSIVVQMIKIGEESGDMSYVLDQVSEFYDNDVEEAVQAMVTMIEPALTGIMGGLIAWIAIAVFGPIYGMFENIEF